VKKPTPKLKPKRVERVRRIPWDELTQEEQRNLEGLAREEEKWRQREKARWGDFNWVEAGKILDRASATRDGLIPPQQMKREPSKSEPKPGSAAALIDVVAPNGTWRNVSAKRLHDLAEIEIERLNDESEREARKQNRKRPPQIKCPGPRAFQTAVAKRRRQERQDKAQ
jgi:hypothetical protein